MNGSEPEAISPLRRRSPGMGVHQEGRQAAREGDYLSPLNVTEGSKLKNSPPIDFAASFYSLDIMERVMPLIGLDPSQLLQGAEN